MNTVLNYQVRSYLSYKGQKTDEDYYMILYDKIPKEIVFKYGYYNLKLLYESFKHYPNCNILTFDDVDFCNSIEFEFMLKLIDDISQITELRFKQINIHNYINSLIKFIKSNHTIKSLSLNQSEIDNEDFKLLCEVIKENDTLESLNFSENDTFTDLNPICDLIQNNKNITKLYFNNVFKVDFRPLIETLKTNNSIKKIKIYDTSHLFDDFCDMLIINKTITHFSYHSLYKVDLTKIKEVLINKNILMLSLYNTISDNWTPLIEGLQINTSINHLNLNNCNITDYKPFYELLTNKQITIMKLKHKELNKDDNIEVLYNALINNNTIQKLDVYGIIINDIVKYFNTIYTHPSLKEIYADIDKDRQIVCNIFKTINTLPDIGYQTCICYKKLFETKDKNISKFIYA